MANVNPFGPNSAKTKSISASSSSSTSVTLDATDVSSVVNGQNQGGKSNMRIVNAGPNTAFLIWGTGTQTATTSCMPMLSGTVEMFTKAWSDNTVAAICSSGQTATIYITCGDGQ